MAVFVRSEVTHEKLLLFLFLFYIFFYIMPRLVECCFTSTLIRDGHLVSRFGLAVRRQAGKRNDLGSIPLRLSFLFKKVVVCGHCRVNLSITSY